MYTTCSFIRALCTADRPWRRFHLVAALAAIPALLVGQVQPAAPVNPTPTEPVLELSPFTVTAENDTGYRAKETLAGSRLRTSLEDVTAPLDIVTAEVIADLGVTTIDNLFSVISNLDYNDNPVFDTVYDSGNIYKIRGFTTNVTLRNFTAGTTPFEAYNSTNLIAAKGPNSILFGAGPGGGSLNYSTKRYQFGRKDSTTLSFKTDNWGSTRYTLDLDQTIIKDRWGLHLSMLHEDQNFEVTPSFWKKRAVYLNSNAQLLKKSHLFKNTELSLSFEKREDETFQPATDYTLMTDYFSVYESLGAPAVLTTNVPSNRQVQLKLANGSIIGPSAATDLRLWGMERWAGNRYTMAGGDVINWANSAYSDRTREFTASFFNQRSFPVELTRPGTLSDTLNYSGYNNGAWVKYQAFDAALQTKVFDSVYLQFVAGRNNSDRYQIQAPSRELWRDVHALLPDGSANPNFGKYYIEGVPAYNDRRFRADTLTLTAAYTLDLRDRVSSRWLKGLVGRHDLALMHSYVEQSNNIFRDRLLVVGTPTGPLNITNYLDAQYRAYLREYIDPRSGFMSDYRNFALTYDPVTIDGYTYQNVPNANGAPSFQGEHITSDLFVTQSEFFNKRLIVNFGYRTENVDKYEWQYAINPAYGRRYTAYEPMTRAQFEDPTYVRTLTNDEPQRENLPDVVYDTVTGISRNLGAIVRLTRNVALVGNTAVNINPSASRIGIYGVSLPTSRGESKDFGIRFGFFDGALRLEYNRYETTRTNDQLTTGALRVPFDDAQNMTAIMKLTGAIASDPFATGLAWDTRDMQSKGHELIVSYNPTRSISTRLAVSYNTQIATNIGGEFASWWSANSSALATYATGPNGSRTNPNSTAITPQTFAESYNDAVALLGTQAALDGQQDPNLASWSAKFLGKYSFIEGSLKGLEVGTNIAWYDDAISNYWRLANLDYDFDRPFYAKGSYTVNAFASYGRKFKVAQKDIRWKIQLNINNLMNERGPIVRNFYNVTADDGSRVIANGLKALRGREFQLTNTFTF